MEDNKTKLRERLIKDAELISKNIEIQLNSLELKNTKTISEFHFAYTKNSDLSAWYTKSFLSDSKQIRDFVIIVSFDKENLPFKAEVKAMDSGFVFHELTNAQLNSIIKSKELQEHLPTKPNNTLIPKKLKL